MPSIPVWLTAVSGPFSVVITPQSVASNGALTDTTPVQTMTASLDDVKFGYAATTEDINAMTSVWENPVVTGRASTMTVGEILKTTGNNLLAQAAQGADYFKIVFTRGAQAWTGYFLLVTYDENGGRGKNTGSGSFRTVNIGTANPTYA